MESESFLQRPQDPVENKFKFFGFGIRVEQIFWCELRLERKINHIQ